MKDFVRKARKLMKKATPAPWAATQLEGKYFPRLIVGPKLPYHDNSGFGDNYIHFNAGNTPEGVASGFYGNKMEACQANAKLVALIINNLPAILKKLEN